MSNPEVIELLKDTFELKRQSKYKRAMELLYKALALCPDNVEILSQVAELHILLNNPVSACAIYEKLIEQQPDNADVVANLVKYYLSIFNFDKARVLLSKFVLSYPSEKSYKIYFEALSEMKDFDKIVEIYVAKHLEAYHSGELNKYYAIALFGQKKYGEALNILEKEVEKNKQDEKLQLYYAKALYMLDKIDKAQKVVMPFVSTSEDAELFNLCGEISLKNENFEAAINLFSQAVKLKYNGLYFYNLATAYFLNGQFKEANNFYLKAISASPDIIEYRYAQAYVFYKLGELKKSKQIIDEILKRSVDFKEAVLLSANILFDECKYFQAESQLAQYPFMETDADYLKLSAKIAKALYKYDVAKSYLQTYVNLYPHALDERFELARIYFDLSNYELAAKLVLEIISDNSNYIEAYILAAKIYLKMFDFTNTLFMADKALALDLNSEEAFYLKALGYLGLKQFENSMVVTKKLLSYNPQKAEAYAILGTCCAETAAYDSALKYYEEALSLDSKNIDYYLNLAVLQEKLANQKEALRYLNLAHALNEDNKEITFRLVDIYVKEKQYKIALKLLYKQLLVSKDFEAKKDLKSNIDEIEDFFKQETNLFKYIIWKIFKI